MANAATVNYLNHEKGLWSWLTTLDHKRIGVLYAISVAFFFLIGGIFALLLRFELFHASAWLSADTYNQFMTYHGTIMVFMVIIPGIPAIFGNFCLPLMLGAKDVAFPRLNLLSWYCLMVGALMGFATLFIGKVDTGWTFYTPYSISGSGATVLMVLAAFVMGFSSILTGLNFIATIHKLRAPGMTMNRIPLFAWSLYATAILQILATPVLAITLILVALENLLGIGFFDPRLGGDPVLFQHFFWFYSHPAVYIMIIPAMGVVSEVITTFSKKTIFGYTAIAYSSLAISAVSFFVWGHHLFVSGQSEIAGIIFSVLSMMVGVPTAIKIFNWVATLYKGSIQFQSPLLYVLGFIFLFMIGGMTGIYLAVLAVNVHFHDTYFVVSHFHYVMVGGTLMSLGAAVFHWWPKITGKMYSEAIARLSFVFVFIGFNVTFFPQFILGAQGMPRRYHVYLEGYQFLNQVSTVGSWIIALGFIFMAYALFKSLRSGAPAPSNPWSSTTLEWKTTSPPIPENFEQDPVVSTGPYEYR